MLVEDEVQALRIQSHEVLSGPIYFLFFHIVNSGAQTETATRSWSLEVQEAHRVRQVIELTYKVYIVISLVRLPFLIDTV